MRILFFIFFCFIFLFNFTISGFLVCLICVLNVSVAFKNDKTIRVHELKRIDLLGVD